MEYFKKNIFKLCIFGFFTLFFLIPSVSAEQVNVGYVTNKTQVLYDEPQAGAMVSLNSNTNVNKYLYGMLGIVLDNVNISSNYLYQLEIQTPNAKLKNINDVYITGGSNGSTICTSYGLDSTDSSYPKIYFKCPANLTSISIGLNNTNPATLTEPITTSTNFQWNYTYLRYFTEDDDIDLGPVISNQSQNTQTIINNQNKLLGNACTNHLNPILSSTTVNGITITNNQDGTFTLNGTASADTGIRLDQSTYNGVNNLFNLEKGTYTLGINHMVSGMQLVVMQNSTWANYKLENQNTSRTITLSSNWNNLFIYVWVPSGTSLSSYLIKPFLNDGSNNVFCQYGTFTSKLDDVSGAIGGVTDAITDDGIGNSTSDASDFITNFNTNTFGLTSIVTAPLNLIQSLTSSTCVDLELPLPYLNNKKLTLPCMTTIYSTYFGSFFTMYQTITYGIIAYWVIVRIFNQVKDFKNPEHDEIEVVDL